jgi:hypothetical protein
LHFNYLSPTVSQEIANLQVVTVAGFAEASGNIFF